MGDFGSSICGARDASALLVNTSGACLHLGRIALRFPDPDCRRPRLASPDEEGIGRCRSSSAALDIRDA